MNGVSQNYLSQESLSNSFTKRMLEHNRNIEQHTNTQIEEEDPKKLIQNLNRKNLKSQATTKAQTRSTAKRKPNPNNLTFEQFLENKKPP